jgi:hypothetical protein
MIPKMRINLQNEAVRAETARVLSLIQYIEHGASGLETAAALMILDAIHAKYQAGEASPAMVKAYFEISHELLTNRSPW